MTAYDAPAVEVSGLVKRFGDTLALDGLDLQVAQGAVYGLLGPNGAGKTTAVRVLATLLHPDGGTARVFGHDVVREGDAVRGRVALTGQFASVDADLTGAENMIMLGRLLGHSRRAARARADELLSAFDLAAAAGRPVRTYSGGMRRRLDIAASIVVRPDLLFLDEPTTGLDPHSRAELWAIVRGLVAGGSTVLLTTQYLDEADQLADRLAVLDHGRVIAEGTSDELKASVGRAALRLRLHDRTQRPLAERILGEALGVPARPDVETATLSVPIENAARAVPVLGELARSGVGLAGFALDQPSLEEVFLTLTDPATASDQRRARA